MLARELEFLSSCYWIKVEEMNLLRYYLMIGGEGLQIEDFSRAIAESGLPTGRITNVKKPASFKDFDSGIDGTSGGQYPLWRTPVIDYAVSRAMYLELQKKPMGSDFLQIWKREEEAIIEFLNLIIGAMPRIEDFCNGKIFILLKLIYGHTGEGEKSDGFLYSHKLLKLLSDLGAGIEIDHELIDVHFDRVEKYLNKA